jgi:hypothetical protein
MSRPALQQKLEEVFWAKVRTLNSNLNPHEEIRNTDKGNHIGNYET